MPLSHPLSVRSRPWVSRFASRHLRIYLVAYAIISIAGITALVWGFARIADAVEDHGRIVRVDNVLTRLATTHDTAWGDRLFLAVSALGPPGVYVAIALGALWFARRRDWVRAGTVLVTGGGGVLLNNLLKMVFRRGRPETAGHFASFASWSFPSGHAMDSIAVYGILTVLALDMMREGRRRTALVVATIVVVGLIGASRVYLGAHYLTDVIAGWLAGGAWLVACVTAYHFARGGPHRLPPGARGET